MKSIENKHLDLEKNITYNYRIITMQDSNIRGKNYETFRSGWTSSEIKNYISTSNSNTKPSYSSSTSSPIRSRNSTRIKTGTPAYSQGHEKLHKMMIHHILVELKKIKLFINILELIKKIKIKFLMKN